MSDGALVGAFGHGAPRAARRRGARLRSVAVACVLAVAFQPTLFAQDRWYDAYDQGLAAMKRNDWRTAERNFRSALDRGPKGPNARNERVFQYGTRRAPFYPEYYLAVSLANQDRARDAMDLFTQIEREGLVPKNTPQFKDVSARLHGAEFAGFRAEANPTSPGPPPDRPTGERGGTTVVRPQPPGGPTPKEAEAERALKAKLEAERALEAKLEAERALKTKLEAERALKAKLESERALEAKREAERALKAKSETELALKVKLDGERYDLERSALLAFYKGQYQQSVDLMGKILARPDAASPRAYFYSACGNAALALLLDGQDRAAGLTIARTLFAKARPFAAQLANDRKYVSPRILAALEQTGPP